MTAPTYHEALGIVEFVAQDITSSKAKKYERVPLHKSVGRKASRDHFSEESTPPFDTSAMDGFAICSSYTAKATPEVPARFSVRGTCAAGDPSMGIQLSAADNVPPCVEIMTGAQFPHQRADLEVLDACVKVEDTHQYRSEGEVYIEVYHPVASRANRRPAGSDIPKGARIVSQGQVIRSSHIMPLASLGVSHVWVQSTPKIGIWSTGNEICQRTLGDSHTRDVNGPYLIAALQEHGIECQFLGTIGDSREEVNCFVQQVEELVESEQFDALITTGGVSVGRFDFVKEALQEARARVHFHGLPMRPGHPVLFASLISRAGRRTAFFGLPGNPGATAATFKFLVSPFLSNILGQDKERPVWAVLEGQVTLNGTNKGRCLKTQLCNALDYFRHGVVSAGKEDGERTVQLSSEQSPNKVFPFARANCWVHIASDSQAADRALVACFELFPESIPR